MLTGWPSMDRFVSGTTNEQLKSNAEDEQRQSVGKIMERMGIMERKGIKINNALRIHFIYMEGRFLQHHTASPWSRCQNRRLKRISRSLLPSYDGRDNAKWKCRPRRAARPAYRGFQSLPRPPCTLFSISRFLISNSWFLIPDFCILYSDFWFLIFDLWNFTLYILFILSLLQNK